MLVSDKILIFSLFVGCFYRKGPALSQILFCLSVKAVQLVSFIIMFYNILPVTKLPILFKLIPKVKLIYVFRAVSFIQNTNIVTLFFEVYMVCVPGVIDKIRTALNFEYMYMYHICL